MRKVLISFAAAASALAVASPAAAQWMPQPVGYGAAYADPGALLMQVGRLRGEIRQLGMRNVLSLGEIRRLDWEAVKLDQRVRRAAFNGMSPGEAYDIQRRIARLQQRVQLAAMTPNRRYGYGYGGYPAYGYGGYGSGGYGYGGYGYGGYGYGGYGAVVGRTSYYGRSPSHSSQAMQVVQRVSAPTMNSVVLGNRNMTQMPSRRAERSFGFFGGGREMRGMRPMRAERSFGSLGGSRGMGRGGRRGNRD